jgi:hypothetical protein
VKYVSGTFMAPVSVECLVPDDADDAAMREALVEAIPKHPSVKIIDVSPGEVTIDNVEENADPTELEPTGDEERDLAIAKSIVKHRFPTAVSVQFATSDQDTYGFNLAGVTLPEGAESPSVRALGLLGDEVWPFVCDLRWNGVVGEDKHGDATVAL